MATHDLAMRTPQMLDCACEVRLSLARPFSPSDSQLPILPHMVW
jgi:hypothetical protein